MTTTWPPTNSIAPPGAAEAAAEAQRQRLADPTLHRYERPIGDTSGCRVCGGDRSWHTRAEVPEGAGISGLTDAEDAALRERIR